MQCVVIDHQVMVLEMLCGVLRTFLDCDVVGTGTGRGDATRLASLPRIDLLIVDTFLEETSSLPLVRSLLVSHPELRCIFLTSDCGLGPIPDDVARHVVAIVARTAPLEELLSAVHAAMGRRAASQLELPIAAHVRRLLTKREYELLVALGRGRSNKEVAATLGLSVRTVETHRKSLSRKLGCNGSALIRLAVVVSLTYLAGMEAEEFPRGRRLAR